MIILDLPKCFGFQFIKMFLNLFRSQDMSLTFVRSMLKYRNNKSLAFMNFEITLNNSIELGTGIINYDGSIL